MFWRKCGYNLLFQVVLEDMSDSLDLVMDQLHEHYDKLPPNGEQLENPRLGQACVAQYSEDKGWYRATISGELALAMNIAGFPRALENLETWKMAKINSMHGI